MDRKGFLDRIVSAFAVSPIVGLWGPHQSGKTTLARMLFERDRSPRVNYFDLEDPEDLARLDHPKLALEGLTGCVVIDEIQRRPELFPILRVLVDRPESGARFLVLGNASPGLLRQGSESLAGRITFIELTPFTLAETGTKSMRSLWVRGGFPRSFLAATDDLSAQWRKAYVKTFLERDVPTLGVRMPPEQMRKFWMMLAHFHGQVLNASEIGRSMGISDNTVKRYIDLLVGTFMVRRLSPYHANLAKRQVKSPKIFLRDSGLLHHLFDITTYNQMQVHPQLGASWEGFALEQVIGALQAEESEVYFWAVHQQAELDLLVLRGAKRLGFEIKYTDSPRPTAAMKQAIEVLHLDQLTVVHPGQTSGPLAAGVWARPLADVVTAGRLE